MANILDYLRQIKDAVYGKDVRSSIYNALYEMNDQIEKFVDELKKQGIKGLSDLCLAMKGARYDTLDASQAARRFVEANESGSDIPVDPTPDEPTEPTITGISVVWSAESADVGTDPKTLITSVKANYSNGTSQTVTGYTVTPSSLAEGTNNVTVSYDGKSAYKSITGVATQKINYQIPTAQWNNGTISGKYAGSTKYVPVPDDAPSGNLKLKFELDDGSNTACYFNYLGFLKSANQLNRGDSYEDAEESMILTAFAQVNPPKQWNVVVPSGGYRYFLIGATNANPIVHGIWTLEE